MSLLKYSAKEWLELLQKSPELELATKNYPSRGQTAVQKLYATPHGKVFLKKVSERNHKDCQVDPKCGSLAEREFWAYKLAHFVGLEVPTLILLDESTTLQNWLDHSDAKTFKQICGPLKFNDLNVFECALFDWLTGQIDRHDANYLYDFTRSKIILIDSAHCFLKYDGSLPDYLSLFEGKSTKSQLIKKQHSDVSARIMNLNLETLKNSIPLKKPEELLSLVERLDLIKRVRSIRDLVQLYRKRYL